MEPDITAISSSHVTDADVRPAVDEPARTGNAGTSFVALGSQAGASRLAYPNGHSNGHGPTSTESHARAYQSIDAVTGPAPWRALAGPVRTTVVTGRYAPAATSSAATRDSGFYLRAGKRLLDLMGASVALVLSSPLLLLAAIAIMIETRGSVLYRSTRVGRGGKAFTFYKLRSMVNGADRHRHHLNHLNECDGPVFKISRDPRVTLVGRFLRTTSLDELPQLWNVLRGDMSLVGPRPPLPEEVSHYQPWQMHRLDVRPGLTCLWQISGRSRIGFEEWMRLDLEYIRRQSFRLDVQILLRTIPAVISQEGAY